MKYSRLILSLTVLCLLLPVIGCGAGEPIIEMPAGEINLTTADLGSDWALQQEQGKDTLSTTLEANNLLDANLRTFTIQAQQMVLASQVINVKSVASAKATMSGDFVDAFTTGMQSVLPNLTLEAAEDPNIGEEGTMLTGNVTDLGLKVYVIAFRKANVIVALFMMGPEDLATKETIMDYSQKLASRIQLD